MSNGNVWSVPAEIPTTARFSPASSEVSVVILIFSVFVGVRPAFSAAALLLGGHDREDGVLARLVLGHQLGDVRGLLDGRAVHGLDHVTGVQPALRRGVLDDGGDDHPGLHRDVQRLQGGHLRGLLGLAELLRVLLGGLFLGLAVRVEGVVRHHAVVVRQPAVDGLHEVHLVLGAGDPDGGHVQMTARLVGLVT
ncbi:hypothetical protein RKD37_003493 [Streptomyces ambofaciens]